MAATSGTPFSSDGGGTIPGPRDAERTRKYWKEVEKDLNKQKKAQDAARPLTKAEKQLAKAMKLRNVPRKLQ